MDAILKASLPKLREKLLEALQAVLPIAAIVLVLCFTIAPVSPSILLCFLLGAAMIVVGIMFFTLGAEMSMTPMGERVGAVITKSRKLPVILGIGFLPASPGRMWMCPLPVCTPLPMVLCPPAFPWTASITASLPGTRCPPSPLSLIHI